jgi:hypothetical protein
MFSVGDYVEVINRSLDRYVGLRGYVRIAGPAITTIELDPPLGYETTESFYNTSLTLVKKEKGGFAKWVISKSVIG